MSLLILWIKSSSAKLDPKKEESKDLFVQFSNIELSSFSKLKFPILFIFPFLSHYSGRGAIYILVGFATISPELINLLNFGGYALIIIGLLCLYMNWLIVKNFKLEYQDFEVMKDNYQDFNDESQKDSLTFPKFITNYDNNSNRNSTNNSYNDKKKNVFEDNKITIKEENKNENIENNILKFKADFNFSQII